MFQEYCFILNDKISQSVKWDLTAKVCACALAEITLNNFSPNNGSLVLKGLRKAGAVSCVGV